MRTSGLLFAKGNGTALMESTLTIKGQATLPKAVRDHLRLRPGDRVKFFIHSDGTVLMLPKVPVGTLRGMLHRRGGEPRPPKGRGGRRRPPGGPRAPPRDGRAAD